MVLATLLAGLCALPAGAGILTATTPMPYRPVTIQHAPAYSASSSTVILEAEDQEARLSLAKENTKAELATGFSHPPNPGSIALFGAALLTLALIRHQRQK